MGECRRAGRVAVQADGLRREPDLAAVVGDHEVLGCHPDYSRNDGRLVGDRSILLERGTSVPSAAVRAVGEGFEHGWQSGCRGVAQQRGVGKSEHGQRVVEGVRGLDDGRGLRVVPDRTVVERAVRLEVRHGAASSGGAGLQRSQLVEHVGRQVVRGDVDLAPTESGQSR